MAYNIYAGIRKDQPDKNGNCAIYIYIVNGNKHLGKKPIGEKIPADCWDNANRQVKRKHRLATLINAKILKEMSDIRSEILKAELVTDLTGQAIKDIINGETIVKDVRFCEFAETQIKEKNYSPETRRAYNIYMDKLREYVKVKLKKTALYFSQIDYKFLQSYEAYLRNELKNSNNTIWGNFKFLNTMVNDALKMNKISVNPFATYKRQTYKNPTKEFLTVEELQKIENYVRDCEDKTTRLVGNYFLFMAYTGLRHSDAVRFNVAAHVVKNERIVMETQKTKQITNILLNDKNRLYMDFVSRNPISLTQVDFNRKLKVIAAGAGVKKKVSSHTARHSFGATLVHLGVPMEVAKGLLSHGSINSTKIYYHLEAANLDEAMRKFNKPVMQIVSKAL